MALVYLFAAVMLLACTPAGAIEPASESRLDEVAGRGARVMPFALDRTVHRFQPNDAGGIQSVVAIKPGDATQVRLVREHLRKIAAEFAAGDYGDPERIHGADMPGLSLLRDARGRIQIEYADVPGGGRIVYSTPDPELRDALHLWFEAQSSDHARHVHPG